MLKQKGIPIRKEGSNYTVYHHSFNNLEDAKDFLDKSPPYCSCNNISEPEAQPPSGQRKAEFGYRGRRVRVMNNFYYYDRQNFET